ncbi:IS1/IS1595 family N-terminal zinc-binding domain-containing protein [Rurimicrobium arvi]|uniref:Terminase ATPase subunit N-terminal domain-containing protein n=1 Tax=Rurimicrobium arvi TaxID=2049916 RepID=A0ABP8MTW3_9BACT
MKCVKCNSEDYTKNGIVKGIQRYKCKICGYNFTVERKSTAISPDKKRTALILYLEGLRVTTIGQMLHVSHVSVLNWVKRYCKNMQELWDEDPHKKMEQQ